MIPIGELKTQFKSIESEIRAALDAVFDSSWYILGKQVQAFEEEFAGYLGVRHCIGVASGTDAIQLALQAVGVHAGDEVLTVANTCVPTVCGITGLGAAPVLLDAHRDTLTMDPDRLAPRITLRTRAIVPVHLYGHPCDMDPILEFAEKNSLAVVEDCAQAHGAEHKGRKCGALGNAAAFSFYPSKNLGAYGDGGAVVTNNVEIAERVRQLRNYGENVRYHHSTHGRNSRLDEIQAAILRVKLKYLDQWNDARRERAYMYNALLKSAGVTLPPEAEWARHIYHLYVIRHPNRDALQEHLKNREIGTLIHYPIPIHLQEAFADLGKTKGSYPVSEKACAEVLSLPMYPELDMDDLNRVAAAVAEFTAEQPIVP